MNELLGELCAGDASIVGTAVCDGSGESIAIAIGQGQFPRNWEGTLAKFVPAQLTSSLETESEKKNVLFRQWAAEPSNIFSMLENAKQFSNSQIDEFSSLQFKTTHVHVSVTSIYEDLYLFIARDTVPKGKPEFCQLRPIIERIRDELTIY